MHLNISGKDFQSKTIYGISGGGQYAHVLYVRIRQGGQGGVGVAYDGNMDMSPYILMTCPDIWV